MSVRFTRVVAHACAHADRYYKGTPLFPFLSGVSYTAFSIKRFHDSATAERTRISPAEVINHHSWRHTLLSAVNTNASVTVTNEGSVEGDAVVALMAVPNAVAISNALPDPLAKQSLIDFARVSLAPGASATITFDPPTWHVGGQYVALFHSFIHSFNWLLVAIELCSCSAILVCTLQHDIAT
jgi:hypothetical protein